MQVLFFVYEVILGHKIEVKFFEPVNFGASLALQGKVLELET